MYVDVISTQLLILGNKEPHEWAYGLQGNPYNMAQYENNMKKFKLSLNFQTFDLFIQPTKPSKQMSEMY